MEIDKGIEMRDLALYVPKEKAVIFSDFHIGYEESVTKGGTLIPRYQFPDTVARVKKILDNVDVKKIIVTGDLKHEFGRISHTEWKQALQLLDLFFQYTKDVVLLKGNHDPILGPIARKKDLQIVQYSMLDKKMICHGDAVIENEDFAKATHIIMGHEHPAVTLQEKTKRETYKCFLKGKFKRKTLIVLPSFNLVTTGTNVLKHELLSPFLQQNLGNFDVYIVEDQVYHFGKLKQLMEE